MYSEVFQLHADLLKALSHPKRLEIVHLLRNQELGVSEIQDMLGIPQANLSQHLMVLRDASVVTPRRNGKQIYYSLTHKHFVMASDLLREVLIERYKDDPLADEFATRMKDLVPLVHDPVCRMRLSPKTASYAHTYKKQQYFFCAEGCLSQFKKRPNDHIPKEDT